LRWSKIGRVLLQLIRVPIRSDRQLPTMEARGIAFEEGLMSLECCLNCRMRLCFFAIWTVIHEIIGHIWPGMVFSARARN
jgi:hypothetical protein